MVNIEPNSDDENKELIFIFTLSQSELDITYLSLVTMYYSMMKKPEAEQVQEKIKNIMSKISLFKSEGIEDYEKIIEQLMNKDNQ